MGGHSREIIGQNKPETCGGTFEGNHLDPVHLGSPYKESSKTNKWTLNGKRIDLTIQ